MNIILMNLSSIMITQCNFLDCTVHLLSEMKEEHFLIRVLINKKEIKIYRDDQVVSRKLFSVVMFIFLQ